MKYKPAYCKSCEKNVKAEKQVKTPNHILHLLITVFLGIFTAGIGAVVWIVIWILASFPDIYIGGEGYTGFSCSECGGKKLTSPKSSPKNVEPKKSNSAEISSSTPELSDKDKAELKELHELKSMGVVTNDEYEEKKKNILNKYD